jgi:glycosyltransferase involved in cell wall biosynthesis
LEKGKEDLLRLKNKYYFAIADSEFNRMDLQNLGFIQTYVLPIVIDFEKFNQKYSKEVYSNFQDGFINILFVGRIAPNKKYEDLLKIFYYFNEINPNSRLMLVGSYNFSQEYYHYLQYVIKFLDLKNVIFTGTVSLSELISYYKISNLFLCMSEHEGFCVPLVEAMYFGIPIMAYNSTGVPYTLNGAGILISQKKFQEIAELMDIVLKDKSVREKIIEGQKERLKYFEKKNIEKKLLEYIEIVKKI